MARGFGVVDLAVGTPAAADTPYPVASLTKTFAAAVIMRLVEAGKLDLDEAMATYDPDYRHWCQTIKDLPEARNYNRATERITVRHHLTHTAQGKPGTTYAYNGFLFARLSAVVDVVSPRGFKRAVEEESWSRWGCATRRSAPAIRTRPPSSPAWRNPMRSTVTGRSRRLWSCGRRSTISARPPASFRPSLTSPSTTLPSTATRSTAPRPSGRLDTHAIVHR